MRQKLCLRSLNEAPSFMGLPLGDWLMSSTCLVGMLLAHHPILGVLASLCTAYLLRTIKAEKLEGYIGAVWTFVWAPQCFLCIAADEVPLFPASKEQRKC